MEIGERKRQVRLHTGLTQTQLIKGICSNTYISKIESGKAKPSYAFILKIAKVLEVEPEFLLNPNKKNSEPDIQRIYDKYMETEKVDAQDLALLNLHAKESHSNATLIKIYYVLISYYTQHEMKKAHQLVEQAKNIISDMHSTDENARPYYLYSVFKYFYSVKNYSEALHYAELHLDSLLQEEQTVRLGKAYLNLATVRAKFDEELKLARVYTKKALAIFKEQEYPVGIGNALAQLAIQFHRNELYEESLKTLEELSSFAEEFNKPGYAPILDYNYGRIYQKLGKHELAIEYLLSSIEQDLSVEDEESTIHAVKVLAEIGVQQKKWEEADTYLQKGFDLTTLYNLPNAHIELLHIRAQMHKARFDFDSYEKDLQQAVQQAQVGKYPLLIKEISSELAEHYASVRAYKMATKYYQIALSC